MSDTRDDEPMSLARPGTVLAGKYRVERVIGSGAMGVVVAATHIHLHERVAIKLLLPDAAGSDEAVARFLREARAAFKIKSEHVARVMDAGVLDTGAPFIIMEHLEGGDLLQYLRARGPLPIEAAVDSTLQVCEALAEAHAAGIVHRDLKPSNLFLTRRADGSPCVKVLDFGISKVTRPDPSASSSGIGMTKTHMVMGSPAYMSPEQIRSARDVDARTDIWSLGVTLYELLTGMKPFAAASVLELAALILETQPPGVRKLRPEAPVGLEAAIAGCLAKDREQRYATVAELAVALVPFGSQKAALSAERVSLIVPSAPRRLQSSPGAIAAGPPGQTAAIATQVGGPVAAPAIAPAVPTVITPALPQQMPAVVAAPQTPPDPAVQSPSFGSTGRDVWGGTLMRPGNNAKRGFAIGGLAALLLFGGVTVVGVVWSDRESEADKVVPGTSSELQAPAAASAAMPSPAEAAAAPSAAGSSAAALQAAAPQPLSPPVVPIPQPATAPTKSAAAASPPAKPRVARPLAPNPFDPPSAPPMRSGYASRNLQDSGTEPLRSTVSTTAESASAFTGPS